MKLRALCALAALLTWRSVVAHNTSDWPEDEHDDSALLQLRVGHHKLMRQPDEEYELTLWDNCGEDAMLYCEDDLPNVHPCSCFFLNGLRSRRDSLLPEITRAVADLGYSWSLEHGLQASEGTSNYDDLVQQAENLEANLVSYWETCADLHPCSGQTLVGAPSVRPGRRWMCMFRGNWEVFGTISGNIDTTYEVSWGYSGTESVAQDLTEELSASQTSGVSSSESNTESWTDSYTESNTESHTQATTFGAEVEASVSTGIGVTEGTATASASVDHTEEHTTEQTTEQTTEETTEQTTERAVSEEKSSTVTRSVARSVGTELSESMSRTETRNFKIPGVVWRAAISLKNICGQPIEVKMNDFAMTASEAVLPKCLPGKCQSFGYCCDCTESWAKINADDNLGCPGPFCPAFASISYSFGYAVKPIEISCGERVRPGGFCDVQCSSLARGLTGTVSLHCSPVTGQLSLAVGGDRCVRDEEDDGKFQPPNLGSRYEWVLPSSWTISTPPQCDVVVDRCFALCEERYGGTLSSGGNSAACAGGCTAVWRGRINVRDHFCDMDPQDREAACHTRCARHQQTGARQRACDWACGFWSLGNFGADNVKTHSGSPWRSVEGTVFPHTLTFNAGEQLVLAGFATSAPTQGSITNFKDFTFKKSDDGITFSEVLSGEGANLDSGDRQEFLFQQPESSQYWQLEMTSSHVNQPSCAMGYVEFKQVA